MAVRGEYIFKINNVYVKSDNDINEIDADLLENKEWKDGYTIFKKNIRRHLKVNQNGRCAFCRCYVSIGTSYSNLEHIVAKGNYPQFEFYPNNLVYCCWLCNKGKSIKNTLFNPVADRALQQYPNNSSGFLIINPYYDNYDEHIDFYDDIIIYAKDDSEKGKLTIKYYSLTRPELAEERAREFKFNQADINTQLLQLLISHSDNPDITSQINQVIEELPYWTIN